MQKKNDIPALPHLVLWTQDIENCGSPSSNWCLPLRSSAKSLDISETQRALKKQLGQTSGSSHFPEYRSVAAGPRALPSRSPGLVMAWRLLGTLMCLAVSWLLRAKVSFLLTSLPKLQSVDHPRYMVVCGFSNVIQLAKILFQSKGKHKQNERNSWCTQVAVFWLVPNGSSLPAAPGSNFFCYRDRAMHFSSQLAFAAASCLWLSPVEAKLSRGFLPNSTV